MCAPVERVQWELAVGAHFFETFSCTISNVDLFIAIFHIQILAILFDYDR